ncbi:MAG: class I lanthipeptide [Actinomycetota bacterium]|nr:class I lanthipeptide [Actinomycetota bacterium]
MKRLQLNKETLRELTDQDLDEVSGGAQTTTCPGTWFDTQTPVCPSGATWFWDCQSAQVSCG